MNFVTVDNYGDRLAALLKDTFPGCTVTEFTDPVLSAKYIINNEVDAVLAAEVMRPADGENLRYVIEVNKPCVRVILLTQPRGQPAKEGWTRFITKEQLQEMMSA